MKSLIRYRSEPLSCGDALDFTISESQGEKGEPITVQPGDLTGPTLQQVVIAYPSGSDAEALQWPDPEQTAGANIPSSSARARPSSTAAGSPRRTAPASGVTS